MVFIFIAVFLLLAGCTKPTNKFENFVVQYYGKNISTIDLLMRLNMTYTQFDMQNIKCPSLEYSCKSICPLDKEDLERVHDKTCYCDKLCVELGDCCFDYFLRCPAAKARTPPLPKQTCIKTKDSDNYGYAMIGSCPSHNTDNILESLCTAKSSTAELFGMLPVSDSQRNTTYKNAFCARCNKASNQTFWKFYASCEDYANTDLPKKKSLMLKFILGRCYWMFMPPGGQKHHLKRCLARERTCPDSELVKTEPLLPDLCSFYAFPVCVGLDIKKKNPHCDICNGKDIGSHRCPCEFELGFNKGPSSGAHSLNILFDFSSTSHTLKVGHKRTVIKNKECEEDFVFDPFNEKCIRIYGANTPGRILDDGASIKSWENKTNDNSLENRTYNNGLERGAFINCSFIKMNISSATQLSNGSIWIPSHTRIYHNGSYAMNGSTLLVCVDFKHIYSSITTETYVSMEITADEIITYTGLTISMICLILLLGIYIALAELRTLPGKNLISLSCAMLLYHMLFFLTGQTGKPYLCMTVSVLLHYFLLSSFCWMGVMAFDVAKTFGTKGQIARSRSNNSDSKKRFVIYSTFAWTTPAVIVITSVALDKTGNVIVGYADHFCWISNGMALLLVVGVPVALILLFNFAALSFTMVSIFKVQKSTRRVADQSNQTSLPVLYIKLSSAMGLTWILAFIVPFARVETLTYLSVILNSLQGFFIFLAFVANKRTVNKVKASWKARFRRLKNADETTVKSKQTKSSKLITTAV